MEREKELIKLINVLRRTARMAMQSEWTGGKEDSAAFCTEQYNRVLARLKEIDASVGAVFDPLPAGSSLTVVAMASRQLAAYFEDELGTAKGFGHAYGFGFDPKMFKEFWENHRASSKISESSSARALRSGPDSGRKQRRRKAGSSRQEAHAPHRNNK